MHIIYIFPVIIQNKGYAPGLALGRRGVSSAQSVEAPGPPPHTPQSPPRTHDLRWSRSSPTRSLHACDDDATLSILATTTLKIRIHMLSY